MIRTFLGITQDLLRHGTQPVELIVDLGAVRVGEHLHVVQDPANPFVRAVEPGLDVLTVEDVLPRLLVRQVGKEVEDRSEGRLSPATSSGE